MGKEERDRETKNRKTGRKTERKKKERRNGKKLRMKERKSYTAVDQYISSSFTSVSISLGQPIHGVIKSIHQINLCFFYF